MFQRDRRIDQAAVKKGEAARLCQIGACHLNRALRKRHEIAPWQSCAALFFLLFDDASAGLCDGCVSKPAQGAQKRGFAATRAACDQKKLVFVHEISSLIRIAALDILYLGYEFFSRGGQGTGIRKLYWIDCMKNLFSISLTSAALFAAVSAQATVVELDVTGSWVAGDYDVSSTGPSVGATGVPEENDDLVFGIAPSDGSTTFTLAVDTSSVVHFATGDFGVTHDWYGYDMVDLVGGHSFGSATWETSDLSTGLIGPNGAAATLWTDADISVMDPTRLSLRMFGDWEGSNADMFIGSRTATTIGNQFLMWEYFGGEEIRSNSYSATTSAVPLPAPALLLLAGLAALGGMKRRCVKA